MTKQAHLRMTVMAQQSQARITAETNILIAIFFLRLAYCSWYVRVTTITVCCCETGHFSSSF